jgi:hypothetical protein
MWRFIQRFFFNHPDAVQRTKTQVASPHGGFMDEDDVLTQGINWEMFDLEHQQLPLNNF